MPARRAKPPPSDEGGPQARAADLVERLRALGTPENVAGMARFGINPDHAVGVSVTTLRRMARETGKDHALALALWATGVHEARILASMVEEPERVTRAQAERWVRAFDSWDLCDQCCMNLFRKTPHAWDLARQWTGREETFGKRAGFALLATLAVHEKEAPDEAFRAFLPVIEAEAKDPRNFVRKAVNWALRQIGKRDPALRKEALALARRLAASDERSARWVGKDAVRELEKPARKG